MALEFLHYRKRRGASLDAISHTEKVIAFCRLLLAITTLVLEMVAAKPPPWPNLAYAVLGGYVGFSALLFVLVRGERVRQERVGPYSVACDVVWGALITLLTEGGATPFFLLNVFVISSVSVRWGFLAAAPITMLVAFLYPALIYCASHWFGAEQFPFHRSHLFRPAYLIVLGYLIGYLGEHERRSKRKLRFMLELSNASRRDRVSALDLVRMVRRVLAYFDAPRALVVLRDPDSTRYFTWDVTRANGQVRLGMRISEDDPLPLPFASSTEALLVNSLQPGSGTALCYDVFSGAIQRKAVEPDLRFPGDAQPHSVLVAPIIVQRELRGRAVVIRDARPTFTRDDLEFLLVVIGQAAASFEAARLQEKAEEVAVLEERARIARDLHDGFIQSLAGIDLRVEAARRMCERDPTRVSTELADLQQVVDRGYREVRAYLKVLRGASRQSRDLESVLDRVAAEFTIRDRLQVRLTVPPGNLDLPHTTTHEIGQIVREALQNAVRHGEATKAVVKLRAYDSHCSLFIRDNGRGFPQGARGLRTDGAVSSAAVPWSIRERAGALGAALRVRSRPGHGAEIVLRIPIGEREPTEQEPRPLRRQM